jgi:hypothetical protein
MLLILAAPIPLNIITRTYQCNVWLEGFALSWARFVMTAATAAAAASQWFGCLQLLSYIWLG